MRQCQRGGRASSSSFVLVAPNGKRNTINDDNNKKHVNSLPEVVKEETRKLNKDRRTRHVLEKSRGLSMDDLRLSQAKLHFRVNVREN